MSSPKPRKKRRIGIELEFHGPKPKEAAQVVSEITGGKITAHHEDRVDIETELGLFRVETDAQFIQKLAKESHENKRAKKIDYEGMLKQIVSVVSEEFVPTELVSPPIEVSKLDIITKIQHGLRDKGAQDSLDSLGFAFAAQLNPEITEHDHHQILNTLKSFILLSDWLKNQIQIDLTRQLTTFAADFPTNYCRNIFNPNYSPSKKDFIADYLKSNSTRNRALDMLPLFAHYDEEQVRRVLPKGQKLAPRPTYHYRLPNCQLASPLWTIEVEWKRWLIVEQLAATPEKLQLLSELYLRYLKGDSRLSKSAWLVELNNAVELMR